MRRLVVILDLHILVHHDAENVRVILAALLVDDHRIFGTVKGAAAQPVFYVDEYIGEFAAVGDYRFGGVGTLTGGSWLISILLGFGAAPSSLTVPETLATVLGSIGVAAGAGAAAFSSVALDDCSVFSFLLHPASTSRPRIAHRPTKANHVFRFMNFEPLLELLPRLEKLYILTRTAAPCRTQRRSLLLNSAHFGTICLRWCAIRRLSAAHG